MSDGGQSRNIRNRLLSNRKGQKVSEDFRSKVSSTLLQVGKRRKRGQLADPQALHPFPARMPAKLAEFLIERLTGPGQTVLDPMMGSGTTLVAARRLGRKAVGFDIDPFSVLLSKVMTTTFDLESLRVATAEIQAKATALHQDASPLEERLRIAFAAEEETSFINYWFPPRSQTELMALSSAIESLQNPTERQFLWVIFSSLIIAKSAGASYALDLAHSRPHRDLDKRIVWPLEAWNARSRRALKLLPFTNASAQQSTQPLVGLGDARALNIPDASIDFVLTSPPYRQAIDYMRTHKFALVWMRHDLEALRTIRSAAIGTERGLYSPDGLSPKIESNLETALIARLDRGKTRRYLSDLRASLQEVRRVLKPGGLAVVVVGPSMISRNTHDAPAVINDLATSAGLVPVETVERFLNVARRTLPAPGKAPASNNLRKRMGREFLVALAKE
jgi:DNA modification methylase